MEIFYTAYTKFLDFKVYYFIKKYKAFPELKNVSPVLESYGMHTDFNRACSIAGIHDPKIKETLLKEAEATIQRARVVEINTTGLLENIAAG
jgi:hypothetical protein